MKSNRGRYQPSNESFDYIQRTTKIVAPSIKGKGKKAKQVETSWHVKAGRLTFGKYKGARLEQILKDNPDYIKWACQNVEGFAVNVPSIKPPKHPVPKKAPKRSALVEEVIERVKQKERDEETRHMFAPKTFKPQKFSKKHEPPY